jgi:hypothetical protein
MFGCLNSFLCPQNLLEGLTCTISVWLIFVEWMTSSQHTYLKHIQTYLIKVWFYLCSLVCSKGCCRSPRAAQTQRRQTGRKVCSKEMISIAMPQPAEEKVPGIHSLPNPMEFLQLGTRRKPRSWLFCTNGYTISRADYAYQGHWGILPGVQQWQILLSHSSEGSNKVRREGVPLITKARSPYLWQRGHSKEAERQSGLTL